jgi:phage shock protein A
MALITRVSRLFRADLHAVLDRIEEPDLLLRQAVRDMETELAADEQRERLLAHERAGLDARHDELAAALSRIGDELDVCFAAGNETLARALIRRRLEARQLRQQLARRIASLRDSADRLQTRIEQHRGQLESMRQKSELLARSRDGESQAAVGGESLVHAVHDEEVEVDFLREKQRRSAS